MERFNNKVALITGGTNGMGFATAQAFIKEGAKVIITGRDQQRVDDAVGKLGANATGIASNAGNMSDITALQQAVRQHTDRIDVLFANAGYGRFAPIEAVDENFFDELFNMHVKGTFFTVQQILPLMQNGGAIILNTSFVTAFGLENFSIYTAAKAAVGSFIKTFSTECTAKGIRVNGISPGHIKTNIFNNTGLSQEQIKDAVEGIVTTLPFKRLGTPQEIAATVLFLSSADAAYIHGAEILVDGGLSNVK